MAGMLTCESIDGTFRQCSGKLCKHSVNFSWYPDYYDEISTPMSLFMINKKLKRGEYESLDTLLEDITLVFENARSYNLEGSEIYDAAVKLGKLAVSKARSLQPNLTVVV